MSNDLHTIKQKIYTLPHKSLDSKEQAFIQHYLGTSKKVLGCGTKDLVAIAKERVRDQDNTSVNELVGLLSELINGETFEEHAVGGKILMLLRPEIRSEISFNQLEKWLAKCHGWVEVDVICQSTYTAHEVLNRFDGWQKAINKFSQSPTIALRRASLVLQNLSVRKSDDQRLAKLAFKTIEKLKGEKEVLITKAISWLLRCLVAFNKDEVRQYIEENQLGLPKIAVRETLQKIQTGKKSN